MSIQNDMSIDEAIQYMEALVSNNPMFPPMKEAAKIAIDALHEKQEAEKNKPLSWRELETMDGQPVWIVELPYKNNSYWALIKIDSNIDCVSVGAHIIHVKNRVDYGDRNLYKKGWIAYRHPPTKGPSHD